jgi:hypothetical protein
MTDTFVVGGTCQASNFVGSGASLTGITRANIAAGTANYVVINNGSGIMTEEQFLATSRGGFGLSTAAFTGLGKVAAGIWSASALVDADVSATAAITRSKLAPGVINQVVINNGSGVMSSEAQLAVSRGGTGVDLSGVGVGPFVLSVSSGVVSAAVGYGSASAASTIVQRDASQNFAANQITATAIAATSNLSLSPTGGFVDLGTASLRLTPAGIAGGQALITSANISTSNAAPTTIYTLSTAPNVSYAVYALITVFNTTGATSAAMFSFNYRVKNIAGTVTNSGILAQTFSADSALTALAVSLSTATTTSLLQVTGIAATTIKWSAALTIVSQTI